ncbi:MAG: phytanoyl-CoA dioxygenase family protein [Saprospirales bacterium]|nr:phytanoyl-CoA dioxygenase family protein [Saprospirales bacterium]
MLGGTLATKVKGKSNLDAHQDWTIVDEQKYNSYNLWIPLIDTNKDNGTLGLIVGSHKWNQDVRGFNISNPYGKYTKQFLEIGFEPTLKAGQAILYNHKLIHYSRPNKTQTKRNTAIIGVKDKAADLQISFCLDNKNIETYKVSKNDFYHFDAQKIKSNNEILFVNKLNSIALNWNEVKVIYSQNLSKEFQNLISKTESFFSKLLNKIGF